MEASGGLRALAALPPVTHWIGGWVGHGGGEEKTSLFPRQ